MDAQSRERALGRYEGVFSWPHPKGILRRSLGGIRRGFLLITRKAVPKGAL